MQLRAMLEQTDPDLRRRAAPAVERIGWRLADGEAWLEKLIGLSLAGMLLIQGAYIGPQPAVFSELFPTTIRYSGASLALTLGTIIGGAPAPSIATYLHQRAGDSHLITIYVVALSIISWLCVLGLRETYREDLSRAH